MYLHTTTIDTVESAPLLMFRQAQWDDHGTLESIDHPAGRTARLGAKVVDVISPGPVANRRRPNPTAQSYLRKLRFSNSCR